jgi:hypothetical protein
VTEPDEEARAALDAAALARVLDGLDVEADADAATSAAHARAAADVAAIRRGFGVLGDALAAPAAAAVAPQAEPDNVVALPLWRRRPGRTLLAAAASIAVLGLGTTLIVTNSGGTEHSLNTFAAQAPPAPEALPRDAQSGYANSAGAAADATAAAPAMPAAPAAGASAAKAAAAKRTNDGTGESLADAVACARGVLIAEVVSVRAAAGDQVSLTLRVIEWISPGSGPAQITYTVGDDEADGSGGRLKKGQQRLFVVPRSTSASVYTFTGPDYSAARAKVAKAQQQDSDLQC